MTQELLITWLGEAYALEQQLIETLENRLKQSADFSEVTDKYHEHLADTKRHADAVRTRLDSLGESIPPVKNALAHLVGGMAGITSTADDMLIRNAVADYTAEHMEIASYTAIEEGAKALGDDETAEMARSILEDEQAMAEWIYAQMPDLVMRLPALQR